METLDLIEAAKFLKLHPEELRRRAKAGRMPAAKIGKCWVFIKEDLGEFVRNHYPCSGQALRVGHKEKKLCHSTNVEVPGGSDSPRQAESKLDALLAQKAKPKL